MTLGKFLCISVSLKLVLGGEDEGSQSCMRCEVFSGNWREGGPVRAVFPNKVGLLVSPQASVGAASDITIPSWTLNNGELFSVDTRGEQKSRRKWRGRRWSNPLCDNSTNSQLFHLTSASTVMCLAPHNLDSVCALPPHSAEYYGPLIERILAPVAACLVVYHQTRELILHQTALQGHHLEVMPQLCVPGASGPPADPSPQHSGGACRGGL